MRNFLTAISQRFDAWSNTLTGYGTSADKVLATAFYDSPEILNYALHEALLVGDPIFAKIATKVPSEALRPGYRLKGNPEQAARIGAAADAIGDDTLENPKLRAALLEACTLSRATGGAALILLSGDSEGEPLTRAPITGLRVASARYVWRDADAYVVHGVKDSVRVHPSRVVPFFGEYAPLHYRLRLRGWGVSHFIKPLRIVQQIMTAYGSIGSLLADAGQGVLKIEGLFEALASNKEELVQKRLAFTDRNRSSGRAMLIDKATEDFLRVPTPFGGIPETIAELRALLALACDMPETELFGRAAAGMNATGEGERIKWYDAIHAWRVNDLGPRITRVYAAIAAGVGLQGPEIEWLPLYEMSRSDIAVIDKSTAETATALIDADILRPEEARAALAANASLFSAVDAEAARESLARAEVSYSDQPDPELPEGPAPAQEVEAPRVTLTPTDSAFGLTVREWREQNGLPPFDGELARYNDRPYGYYVAALQAQLEREFPPPAAPGPVL